MTRMRVALLTVGDPGRMTGGYLFHQRMAERASQYGARLAFVSLPTLALPWAILAGPAWRRRPALRDADVVVIDSIAAAAAAPWLPGIQAPVVGMLHQLPGGMDAGGATRALRAPFDCWAYRHARMLMVASEWLRDELVGAGFGAARLRLVEPGNDPATGAEVAHHADVSEQMRAGRAIAALPADTVTLHLVGARDADRRYGRRVAEALRRPELSSRVVVHGTVRADEVAGMYRSVDAFVLPSFVEPYGTVWGEAMAAGLPVVGWSAGNLPYLADHEREALLVPVGDVAALSGAIARLAADRALRLRLGAAAARRAASRPTWEQTAERFFSILDEARQTRSGRSTVAQASGDS